MTTVWVVHPQGVYHHEPIGVFSTEARARSAAQVANRYSDGHHVVEVTAYELDTWNSEGLERLTLHPRPPEGGPPPAPEEPVPWPNWPMLPPLPWEAPR